MTTSGNRLVYRACRSGMIGSRFNVWSLPAPTSLSIHARLENGAWGGARNIGIAGKCGGMREDSQQVDKSVCVLSGLMTLHDKPDVGQ